MFWLLVYIRTTCVLGAVEVRRGIGFLGTEVCDCDPSFRCWGQSPDPLM